MSAKLCGCELYCKADDVGHEVERKNLHYSVSDYWPETPVQTICHGVLVARVPDSKEECRNEGEHRDYHHSLEIDAVPDVRAFAGHSVRDEEECLEGVERRMKESKLSTFLKGRLDFVNIFS